MQGSIENIAFFQKLRKLDCVEEIWLYGSRARGDNEERSDIDIAIRCPQATDGEWSSILDIIDEANTLLKIDCVSLGSLKDESLLKKNILSEGICLYRSHKVDEKHQ